MNEKTTCYSANHVQYLCQKETLCGNGEGPMDAAKARTLTSHKLVQSSLYHIIFFNARTTTNKNNATKLVNLPVHNQIETYIMNTLVIQRLLLHSTTNNNSKFQNQI